MTKKTYHLPADVSRCFRAECPLKQECLRYLDRWHGDVISDFKPENGKCENQIKLKK
ncbi:hypothetical protein [Capnocytophaga cynodegmi]|uniref:hypothetical protein n=1 Tax=Capnocytophaga cynodegmi TaxID=28189 RepID=UPI001BB30985|nr:hypothetical protein [Capnocytophaga cynodegmi]